MKRRRRIITIFLSSLLFVLPWGASACNKTPESQHTQTDSNIRSNAGADIGEAEAAPHIDTNACDQSAHSFDTEYGYEPETPHTHSWSELWSTDYTYHWRDPLCNDTEEIKDKAQHNFVKNICSECGYNRTPDAEKLIQTDFNDVGEKFRTVAAPLYDAAETILQDLVDSGDVVLSEARNPRIVGIRYFYGKSLTITVREDIYKIETGEKSEFLHLETGIDLENFGTSNDEAYLAYKNFLRAERKSQSLENYEEFILPYAERSAELILAQYERYKANKEITPLNFGKVLILSPESSLSENYNKIVANLNSALAQKNYPLITDQDLDISFGGNIYWEIVNRWICIQIHVGNLNYVFYLSFNENGEFSEDFINYYLGTRKTGYIYSIPDYYNPKNEEFSELFEQLKIEIIDLSNIESSYGYEGVGNALYSPSGEDTNLYF